MDMVEGVLTRFGVTPPEDYVEFMCAHDGATGFCGRAYVIVESLAELEFLSTVKWEEAPWLFHFGSNGSSTSYAFDTRSLPNPIVAVDMIDRAGLRQMGSSLAELLQAIEKEASTWPTEGFATGRRPSTER